MWATSGFSGSSWASSFGHGLIAVARFQRAGQAQVIVKQPADSLSIVGVEGGANVGLKDTTGDLHLRLVAFMDAHEHGAVYGQPGERHGKHRRQHRQFDLAIEVLHAGDGNLLRQLGTQGERVVDAGKRDAYSFPTVNRKFLVPAGVAAE